MRYNSTQGFSDYLEIQILDRQILILPEGPAKVESKGLSHDVVGIYVLLLCPTHWNLFKSLFTAQTDSIYLSLRSLALLQGPQNQFQDLKVRVTWKSSRPVVKKSADGFKITVLISDSSVGSVGSWGPLFAFKLVEELDQPVVFDNTSAELL